MVENNVEFAPREDTNMIVVVIMGPTIVEKKVEVARTEDT